MELLLEAVERFRVNPADREERDGDTDENQIFHDVFSWWSLSIFRATVTFVGDGLIRTRAHGGGAGDGVSYQLRRKGLGQVEPGAAPGRREDLLRGGVCGHEHDEQLRRFGD